MFLAALLANKWTWIGVGGVAVILLGFIFGGAVKSWWGHRDLTQAMQQARAAQQEAGTAKAALAAAQQDTARMTQQIATLRRAAEAAMARATAAEGRAAKWQQEAARLGSVVTALEAERQRLRPVQSLHEAQAEIRRAGYDLPVVVR